MKRTTLTDVRLVRPMVKRLLLLLSFLLILFFSIFAAMFWMQYDVYVRTRFQFMEEFARDVLSHSWESVPDIGMQTDDGLLASLAQYHRIGSATHVAVLWRLSVPRDVINPDRFINQGWAEFPDVSPHIGVMFSSKTEWSPEFVELIQVYGPDLHQGADRSDRLAVGEKTWLVTLSSFGVTEYSTAGALVLLMDITTEREIFMRMIKGVSLLGLLMLVTMVGSSVLITGWLEGSIDAHPRALREGETRYRQISRQLQAVREEESRRIAVWLHDEVGQLLTRARMDLMMMEGSPVLESPATADAFQSLKQIIDDVMRMIRFISVDLRPPILDDFGLVAALEWSLQEDGKRLPIRFVFDADAVPLDLHPDIAIGYYRMARECLTNIAKHANATEVSLSLRCEGGQLMMVISDNGKGMAMLTGRRTTLGIAQLQERADVLGGTVEIDSRPHQGTTVRIAVPLRFQDQGGEEKT